MIPQNSKIIAVCLSENRGEKKKTVDFAKCIKDYGIEGDAHAGSRLRQVSFLSVKDINIMKQLGIKISHGDFAENVVVDGDVLDNIAPGDLLKIEDGPQFQVTQIGKDCHDNQCPIKKQTGKCVMPERGIFAKVIKSGKLKTKQIIIKTTKKSVYRSPVNPHRNESLIDF